MSFVAEATRDIAALPERIYDTLADHDGWPSWLPASFRPLGRALGTLEVGARPRVRIGRVVPARLRVIVAERGRELTWCGGLPGVLYAEHRFLFEAIGRRTRVRSVETWSGRLARAAKPIALPLAEKIAGEQLAALARACA